MAKVRLGYGNVTVGQPLPFDLTDGHGRALLKHGYIIRTEDQLDRLIERGVFFERVDNEEKPQAQAVEKTSVFLCVCELADAFAGLLDKEKPDYGGVPDIAEKIQTLCEQDSDAALACILLRKKGRYALRHSFHAAVLTEILLKRLGHPAEDRRYAVAGALTMNMCMLELQDALYRQNTPLTLEQKRSIVSHPLTATAALREQGIAHPVWLKVVELHHEMIDGSGYAQKLLKNDLCIESQTVSLADRFCAMVSEREYRRGLPPGAAVKDLLGRQAATITPELADAFRKEVGCYPPGSVVTLVNSEMGVVVKRLLNPTQPLVRSLRAASGVRYPDPPKRATSKSAFAIKEELDADAAKDFDLVLLWRQMAQDETDEE
jgi:HD-GYP domain-containing protein (c-di-GMP phosphodiesterase class II)